MEDHVFADRLVQARDAKKMTMRSLSQAAGVSPQSMSQYAKGDAMPPLRSAIKIAEALGVSLDWLCGMQEETQGPVQTYGEVARMLLRMEANHDLHGYIGSEHKGKYMKVWININQHPALYDFFKKLHTLNGMKQTSEAEIQLTMQLIELMLKELDSQPIDGKADVPDADELPF